MSCLTVDLDPELPARLLCEIGRLREEFPGSDELVLTIGPRRLVVPNVGNGPRLRAAVLGAINAVLDE